MLDQFGDDDGPGGYTYPTGEQFRESAFDLRFFGVTSTPDRYRFNFKVETLYDALETDRGFSPHTFVLWIHDPSASGGRTSGRDDLGVNADFEHSWQYRLMASGTSESAIRADGSTLIDSSDIAVEVDTEESTVTIAVPSSSFEGDVSTFSVVAGVHSASDGVLRPIEPEATESAFGGADPDAAENAPRLSDVLTEPSVQQADALAYSAEERASIPFVPLTDAATVTTAPSGSGDGPGFGVVSGLLGTAGGVAYGIRSLTEPGDTDER